MMTMQIDSEAMANATPSGGAAEAGTALDVNHVSQSFRESKIAIALDVSGSTWGDVIRAEKRAIESVCSIIPRSAHSNITILPWDDSAWRPRGLAEIDGLEPNGGTDPNVILANPSCRQRLVEAGFWFLMTDGIIQDSLVRKFARSLAGHGIHGKACIISVFGVRVLRPSDCNISVGLSVFAVSPHVAFLYTDVEFNKTYVLSTKGCFSALLPSGQKSPVLDYKTKWEELPQVSYENLARISVPPPQVLHKDEVALQNNIRVSLPALLDQETVDENIMREIMLNEDNLRTIAITAKLRGESERLGTWLDKVDAKIGDMTSAGAGTGSQLLEDIETKLNKLDEDEVQRPSQRSASQYMPVRNAGYQPTSERAYRMSSDNMRRISSSSVSMAADNLSVTYDIDDARETISYTLNLANTGFLRPTQTKDYFRGSCSKCGQLSVVLTLLLKEPDVDTPTDNLPLAASASKLIYPLTMGNYAETDIISNSLVCDECSARLVKGGITPEWEKLITVLPLVSYAKNKNAWLQTVYLATKKRFDLSSMPLVFLAILYTKLERLLSDDDVQVHPHFRLALEWECQMLLSEVILHESTTIETNKFGSGALQEVLLRNFRCILNHEKSSILLRYPLDGFIVANAALSNSRHNTILNREKRKNIVLFHFLYHIVENFVKYRRENGPVQLHAAKTLLLLVDNPSGPRALFRWNSVRSFSVNFKSLDDFQKHLRERVNFGMHKLSINVTDLVDTPLLSIVNLGNFRRLGVLFNWIENQAGHAIAIFVHHLMRSEFGEGSAEDIFRTLRGESSVNEALSDPASLSARNVESMIKGLDSLQ